MHAVKHNDDLVNYLAGHGIVIPIGTPVSIAPSYRRFIEGDNGPTGESPTERAGLLKRMIEQHVGKKVTQTGTKRRGTIVYLEAVSLNCQLWRTSTFVDHEFFMCERSWFIAGVKWTDSARIQRPGLRTLTLVNAEEVMHAGKA